MSEILESRSESPSEIKTSSLQDLNTRRLDALEELGHLERIDHRQPTPQSRAAVLAKRLEIETILQETLRLLDAELDELVAKERQGSGLSADEKLRLTELHDIVEITQSRLKAMHGGQENSGSNL